MNGGVALLLAIVGGAVLAFVALLVGVAAIGGFLWIYAFGDRPWPEWVESTLNAAIPIAGLLMWWCFGWLIWRRLKTAPARG